jgi:hypothetical protein
MKDRKQINQVVMGIAIGVALLLLLLWGLGR